MSELDDVFEGPWRRAWVRVDRVRSASLPRYITRRLLLTLITLFLITVTVFVITNILPGNPALVRVGALGASNPEILAAEEERMGLNRPLLVRYGDFVSGAVQGDLGTAFSTERPVMDDLADRLPATLELAIIATIIATLIGIPLGFLAAVRRDSKLDHFVRNLSGLSAAMPVFWLGLILAFVFVFQLAWAPGPVGRLPIGEIPPPGVTGFYTIDSLLDGDLSKFADSLSYLALPAVALMFIELAPIMKMSRSAMLEILNTEYVRTSRAMGFSGWQVFRKDAVRNALIPVLTTLGIVLGYLVAGSVVIETIYSWPGIGKYAFESVNTNDFNAIQGFVLTIAVIYVLLNTIIDVMYAIVDPRIRLG